MSPTWQMRGEYVENCNCDVICPCAVSQLRARPTQGHCDVVFAFTVQEGNFGDTPLGGLSFVMALQTPGPMGGGNGKLALYLDERADQRQREALEAIALGRAGGPPGAFANAIPVSEFLGVTYAPITFTTDGKRRSVQVRGVLEMDVEGIEGRRGVVAQLSNVVHFASATLAIARGVRTSYRDRGFAWDNSGKNAHYAPFQWRGP